MLPMKTVEKGRERGRKEVEVANPPGAKTRLIKRGEIDGSKSSSSTLDCWRRSPQMRRRRRRKGVVAVSGRRRWAEGRRKCSRERGGGRRKDSG